MFGRRHGVRMSLLVSADSKAAPGAVSVFGRGTRLLNRVLDSSVRFQHLPVPFELYSDGIDLPVFEEFGAGTAALHLRDQLQRNELLADTDYRREFRREFDRKKLGPTLWHRDFHDAVIVECPDESLIGKSFGTIADERGLHPLDAFLDVLVDNGERNVRWTTTVANHRQAPARRARDRADGPHGLLGRGRPPTQHGLLQLRIATAQACQRRASTRAVPSSPSSMRCTDSPPRSPTGSASMRARLRRGDRADFVVIDPAGLDDTVDGYHEASVPFYGGLSRMVNRNDAAVVATAVNGEVVYRSGEFRSGYGQSTRTGRFLRASGATRPTADVAVRA